MIDSFIAVATIIFLFYGVIWRSDSWPNVFLRLVMFLMTFWGAGLVIKDTLLK